MKYSANFTREVLGTIFMIISMCAGAVLGWGFTYIHFSEERRVIVKTLPAPPPQVQNLVLVPPNFSETLTRENKVLGRMERFVNRQERGSAAGQLAAAARATHSNVIVKLNPEGVWCVNLSSLDGLHQTGSCQTDFDSAVTASLIGSFSVKTPTPIREGHNVEPGDFTRSGRLYPPTPCDPGRGFKTLTGETVTCAPDGKSWTK